jgi:molybdopterin converting factor small subunit
MKTILVRVNGALAEALGTSRLGVQLPSSATVGDLIAHLQRQYPQAAELFSRAAPVASGKHLDPTAGLTHQQEIALLMPIAGG